jgi:hypothetical protein
MSNLNDGRPLGELLGGLAQDISSLFRKEVQLAKAETSEKVSELMTGVEVLLAGGVLLLGALGVLLAAIVSAIAAFFVSQGMGATLANSLAALIVTVIVGGIGWVLVQRGLASLKSNKLQLDRTAGSLGRDAAMVKERI